MCASDNNGYLHSLKLWAYRQENCRRPFDLFFTKLWKCKLFRKELQIFSAYKVLPSFLQSGVYLGLQVSTWHLAFANMRRWTHVPTNNFVTTKISWLHRWPNFITHGAPLCLHERAPLSVLVFSPVFCDVSVVVVVFFPPSFYRSVRSDRLFFRATVRKYRALSSKSWKIDLVHFLYIDSFYVDKKADVNFFPQKPSICEENLNVGFRGRSLTMALNFLT